MWLPAVLEHTHTHTRGCLEEGSSLGEAVFHLWLEASPGES